MRVIIKDTYDETSYWCALYIKNKIIENKDKFVLGLPTGSTPIGIYKKLIEFYENGEISFKNVITFNMDEYIGLKPNHPQSYRTFMYENLFNHIDILPENINLLNGLAKNLLDECTNYEKKIKDAGGIDLFLCGIGRDGHIAFNEPGSSLNSLTRIKTLSEETITDNARFFNTKAEIPTQALTVGVKTIMDAKEIILMASGTNKALAIKHCIEGSVTNQYTCTVIQLHSKASIICDKFSTYELKYKTNTYINSILSEKKIVLALGASTKGNILLQHFGLGKDKIPFISERNSTKVGLRCLGTDIELISEEKARSLEPKAMLVLPWYFKEEIVKREKKYIDNGGQLMFPMPYPHVVTKKAEIKL